MSDKLLRRISKIKGKCCVEKQMVQKNEGE